MKTALVTGSSGFLGRHFAAELESLGWSVDRCDLVEGQDAMELHRVCTKVYDLVVPAAYNVGGRAAIDGTNTNFAKNVALDGALFEWAVRTKQKRVLYFSSSAAYPTYYQTQYWRQNPDSVDLYEDIIDLSDPLEYGTPDANYGWSKLTGERLAEDARRSGLNVTVVRPFSGYGEDQSLDYPFPSIVQRASRGNLTVWGPPGQSRDWIHVDDVVKGALAVVESETEDPVNLCTGVATEMGDLARRIRRAEILCPGDQDCCDLEVEYLTDKPTGVSYRVGDPTRMRQYYTPRVSLEEGIRRALDAQQ